MDASAGAASSAEARQVVDWTANKFLELERQHQLQMAAMQEQFETLRLSVASPASSSSEPRRATIRPTQPKCFRGVPREDVSDVATWIDSVNDFFIASRYFDDAERVAHVGTMLEGRAAVWWRFVRRNSSDVPTTWVAFSAALRLQFEPVTALLAIRQAFATVRQTTSVQAYVSRFRELLIQLPDIGPDDSVFRFIEHLKPTVQLHVRLHDPTDLEDAIRLAENIDNHDSYIGTSRGTYFPSSRNGPRPMELGAAEECDEGDDERPWHEVIGEDDPDLFERLCVAYGGRTRSSSNRPIGVGRRLPNAPLSAADKERSIRDGLCFSCGKAGHPSRECPDRPNQSGHPKGRAPSS